MLEHQLEGSSFKESRQSTMYVTCNSIKHKHNYKKLSLYLSVRYRLEYAVEYAAEINNPKCQGSFLTHTKYPSLFYLSSPSTLPTILTIGPRLTEQLISITL